MKYKGYEVLVIKLKQDIKLINSPTYRDPWIIAGPFGYLNIHNEWTPHLLANCSWMTADSAIKFWEKENGEKK